MNREELIENIAYEISAPISCDKNCKTCEYDKSNLNCMSRLQATNVVDYVIKHEQDTLKEFVEWQAKQYKDLYYMYEEENEKDHEDYLWLCGRKAGIGEVRKRLNQDLENFLKERDK